MTSNYPETTNFGLTRVGEGDSLQKNNFGATDGNFISLDRILKVLADHDHTGGTRLADPTVAPELAASPSGGFLPAGQTYYYQYSYVDIFGLETAASPEVSITTPPPLGVPTAPALSAETTGGTLGAGIYRYVLASRTPGGGVTTTSPPAEIIVDSGTTNRILINLPDLPTGAEALLIYRARPGQTQYYYWKESTTAADLYDDGTVLEDQTVLAPAYNTSSGTNSVTATLPGGVVPAGVKMWRLYRASSPGVYNGLNLVHLVSEGVTESSTDPRPNWTDDGSPLFRGQPLRTSGTIAPPPAVGGSAGIPPGGTSGQVLAKIDATDYHAHWVDGGGGSSSGAERSWSVFVPGTVVPGTVYGKTTRGLPYWVTQMTAYFQSAPTTSPTGAQVGFELIGDYDTFAAERWNARRAVATDGSGAFGAAAFPKPPGLATAADVYAWFEAENGHLVSATVVNDTANYSPYDQPPGGKAARLDLNGDQVHVDLGNHFSAGDYLLTAHIYTPNSTEANGLKVTIYKNSVGNFEEATPVDVVVEQIFTARLAAPASGFPGEYVIPFRVSPADVSDSMHFLVRVVNVGTLSTSIYDVDEFKLAAASDPYYGGMIYDAGPVSLRATLVDYPAAPQLPPFSRGPGRKAINGLGLDQPTIRVFVREGMETSVAIDITSSDGASMSWSASSDQSWCTLSAASGTGFLGASTATVNFASLSAGSRNVATVTFTASGYETLTVQVVALRTPAALGGNVNVTISDVPFF